MTSTLHNLVVLARKFQIRYRWVFILVVIALTMVVLFGNAELWKALYALGLEQALIHLGRWSAVVEVAEDAAENV